MLYLSISLDTATHSQSGPRHCGPLKNSKLGEYGLVPNATARKFRHGYLGETTDTGCTMYAYVLIFRA